MSHVIEKKTKTTFADLKPGQTFVVDDIVWMRCQPALAEDSRVICFKITPDCAIVISASHTNKEQWGENGMTGRVETFFSDKEVTRVEFVEMRLREV